MRALALGDTLPRSLRGDVSALSLRGLDDLTFPGAGRGMGRTMEALDRAYAESGATPAGLARGGRGSLEAMRRLQEVAGRPDTSKVAFPDTDLGRRAKEAARLIRADVGLEVIELDLGGWDTHQNQGGATGTYANNVRQLADALAALVRDLEEQLDDVLILTVTEFGRTARQNGTFGTDHGWASCSFAFGGPVRARRHGRPTFGTWPGLAPEQRNQGRDLAHTVDFRDVYGEVAGFLGSEDLERVLPGPQPTSLGWLRSSEPNPNASRSADR